MVDGAPATIKENVSAEDAKAMEAITITGGTYQEDPSDYVPAGFTAVQTGVLWTVQPAE